MTRREKLAKNLKIYSKVYRDSKNVSDETWEALAAWIISPTNLPELCIQPISWWED